MNDRIKDCIVTAAHHRDQIDAIADEFVALHFFTPGSCDADDIQSVIYDGVDYDEVMEWIERRYRELNEVPNDDSQGTWNKFHG